MAAQNRTTLKGHFNTSDVPTEAQFADTIDSFHNLTDDGTPLVNVVEDITPQLGGQLDVNGNAIGDGARELLTFTEDALAVNHVNIENQATGSGPIISAAGDDTNIDLQLAGKGTGTVKIGTNEVAVVAAAGNLAAFTGLLGLNSGTAVDVNDLTKLNDRIGVTLAPNLPQNSQSAAYTLVLADANKHVYHPSADTTARTFTIPANASVAFPIGTAVTFINDISAGVVTIAITTDTLAWMNGGSSATGSRTLAAGGMATAVKVTATRWAISGVGLT